MRRRIVLFLPLTLIACASPSKPPLAETSAALSMHDFMKTVIDPSANVVFAAGNDPDEDAKPAEIAAQWTAALTAAGIIQESGRLLLLPPRARTDAEWTRTAQTMVDAGADANAAALAKDRNAAFEAGGKLYDACNGCHSRFVHGKT